MKKILYATDFSKNAEKAFDFALKIAEKHRADLVILHVFNVPPVYGNPYNTVDPVEMKRQAVHSWISYLRDFFEQFITDIHPTFIALENPSVVKGVLSVIKKHEPDLVVTGTKGKSLLKEIFVGSTTKALVKQSPVPVLAIPSNADYSDFDNVLYASDFREVDLDALEQLIKLVKPFKPEIKLVHVSSEDEYNANQKMEWFKDLVKDNISYKHISFKLLRSERVFERLTNYVQNHNLDMMVMLEKERTRMVEKLFHEDLVWKMEFHATIPILSYNEHYLRARDEQDAKKGDAVEQ